MSSENVIKNTSLTLSNREETSKLGVPLRNAFSSVKRLKEPIRSGRVSCKPFRLSDLTQELLEAKEEPLKKLTYEEMKEADTDTDSEDKQSVEGLETALLDVHIQSPKNYTVDVEKEMFDDIGVTWLETPARIREPIQNERVSAVTPQIHCGGITVPAKQQFVSPYSVKSLWNNDKPVNKPKIQYSIDIKSMMTPLSNGINRKTTPQYPSFKNTSGDSEARLLKPSLRHTNSVAHETNKENISKNVQFSLPPSTELKHEILKEIKVKNISYIILNQLGIGGSSVVYHCYNPLTDTECAIKKVTLGNDANTAGYINEVKVLERLQKCDRIIKMFDYELIESEKTLLVVLERGGLDLSKILKDLSNTNKHIPMYILIFYWMEMLHAVKQIHENGIVHSDLKPGNFLQAEGCLKLIDFGIASCVQEDMTCAVKNIVIGSFNYISPEAVTNDSSNNCDSPSFGKPKFKVSYRSDVWSLGCILYQLVYRRTPFQHIGHTWAKLSAIVDPEHKINYPQVDWVPSRIVNTIKKCLQYDMRARPSVDELIQEYENIYN